jgi:23S rRNA pseudouridine1911/1915/1917 synthase
LGSDHWKHTEVDTERPLRLDAFVRVTFTLSATRAREAVANHLVLVNGRRARKGVRVRKGDVVSLHSDLTAEGLRPQAELPVRVLYEDDAMAAVSKPAGMPAVALRPSDTDTLANFLVARFPECAEVGDRRYEAGAVHRLDNATSGLMLAARTAPSYSHLRRQFRGRQVDKRYVALVHGVVQATTSVDTRLQQGRDSTAQVRVAKPGQRRAREARTDLSPIERLDAATVVEVHIQTGVRHQIRVHLASIGHPIVGDSLYSEATAPRLMLHAERLRLTHPVSGKPMDLEDPPPASFQAVVDQFR